MIISVRRGTRSAVAPAKRARKLNPILADAVSPTRNGESVRFSTYQTTTIISIWDPIWEIVIADQMRPKLRWRSMEMGRTARPRFAARFDFTSRTSTEREAWGMKTAL